MKKTAICAAIVAMSMSAAADELSDLKAEIAAQRQAAAAQKARLDMMEEKLNTVQQQQAAGPAPAGTPAGTKPVAGLPAGVSYTQGDGLSFSSPSGSVTLYGLIDASYVRATHASPNGSTFGPRLAWFSGNRWGITGKRAMGDSGVNAIFRLESEFYSQTGEMDTPGVLFNRDAWVGVESAALGKFTLGRQNAIARDPAASAIYGDPYGPATPSTEEGGYTNNNNFKALVFYAGSATGTRIDNGVVWKKAFSNGLVTGLQYQFGGNAADFSNATTETVTLAYGAGAFNVAGFATAAKVAQLANRSYSVGGNYTVGPVRLNAGIFHYTAEQAAGLGNRSDNAYTVSGRFAPAGKVDYELGYQTMRANNAAVNAGGNVINAFANASAAKATATGNRNTLYGSIFYHFDRNSEVYLAADHLRLTDGYKVASTNGASTQTQFALGFRTRF